MSIDDNDTSAPDEPDYDHTDDELDNELADEEDDDFPDPAAEPIPKVIAWERLDASEYQSELAALDDWVRWLCRVYAIDTATIPHCWYRHPDLLEELGHLKTAWLMTQHPEAGVGAIGLDWDRGRDLALAHCKTMTSATGCTPSSGHRARTLRVWPGDHQRSVGLHLAEERAARDSAGITTAAHDAAAAALAQVSNAGDVAAAVTGAQLRAAFAAEVRHHNVTETSREDARTEAVRTLSRTVALAVATRYLARAGDQASAGGDPELLRELTNATQSVTGTNG